VSTIPKRVAIFASGAGGNAKVIIEKALQQKLNFTVALIVCNKPEAGVLVIAKQYAIPSILIEKEKFFKGDAYIETLKKYDIEFIVLAGFLWKIPATLIGAFTHKIINIHPALLPKYGGKGMYGKFVHEAVVTNKETETGVTIHYVDEVYDHGKIIFQTQCTLQENDTPITVAQKVQALEHEHYWRVINEVVSKG
jgi:phosphoribosylglycinamide formyltransferase 1